MTIEGVDFANQRPPGEALVRAGKEFVVRYLSPNTPNNPRKTLTLAEVGEYHGAGLAICVVWETGKSRARLGGYAGGRDDAIAAHNRLVRLGGPESLPIYFAVDEDTTGPAVDAYFRGVADMIGVARTGAYGGIKPISYLFDHGLIGYGWQTYAWSGGRWDPRAQAQQYNNDESIPGAGSGYDLDRATVADYGQWNPDGSHGDTGVIGVDENTIAAAVWAYPLLNNVTGQNAPASAYPRSLNTQVNDLDTVRAPAILSAIAAVDAKLDALSAKVDAIGTGPTGNGLSAAQFAAAERAAADAVDPRTGT